MFSYMSRFLELSRNLDRFRCALGNSSFSFENAEQDVDSQSVSSVVVSSSSTGRFDGVLIRYEGRAFLS